MSGRACRYASESPSENTSTPDAFQATPEILRPEILPLATASAQSFVLPAFPHMESHESIPVLDGPVNLNHMELLIHVMVDKSLFSIGYHDSNFPANLTTSFRIGLESPYVLHQLLAFSARHLAFLHPDRADSYLHQAVSLQTRAISLFNASRNGVDESNCVAMLLFSAFLGHHTLTDTLAKRDAGGLEAFMFYFIQCIDMQRGVHAIAQTAWPLLMKSELKPLLSWSSQYNTRLPRGNHCQQLNELVDNSNGLSEEEKEACQEAARCLQIGFDAVFADKDEERGNRFHMVHSWVLLLPPPLRGLLVTKRPEALVLLGYYALLLHYGRNLWQIGDAGAFILGIVNDHLGSEWAHWLKWPREEVAKTLVA
ncbi:conserved hypothetical protein [Talaromyces marneffei ATCC 18224]|uniref:C6 finger domain protein n=3 Tax=Talaromyces marneffei TaxID=37727 RepID=B6Q1S1_TALMQ|nr:conserved hypothetical protein [Talaromyces marneffei ATCC 18224]